jgi:hypothetical protein
MQGNSLVATSGHGGGARRIQVTFDGSYAGCSAAVIIAKQVGSSKIIMRNLVSNKQMELLSATASAASCSVQAGNVFGGS